MQIAEFIPTPGFPSIILWPIVLAFLFAVGFTVAFLLHRYSKKSILGEEFGSRANLIALAISAFSLLVISAGMGGIVDTSENAKARSAHYATQTEAILDRYSSLRADGIQPSAGYLQAAIVKQGSFVPLGTAYQRTGSGVESYAYVMTLTDDWTLEIFQTTEGDQLVRVEPATL
jgi:hypothetical protein